VILFLKPQLQATRRFAFSLLCIWLIAVGLRFWGLGRFNDFVFDEVYFAKFANHYLTDTPFFDAHPPLGKYLIAISIWVGQRLPWLEQLPHHNLAETPLTPISYRWLNALAGSLVPLVVAGIAYQLNIRSPVRQIHAVVAGLLVALDGLLLVESRYALLNIYMVLFGLLSHWCVLRSLSCITPRRSFWLLGSGLLLGATVAVKWNGLGFWLGLLLMWLAVRFAVWVRSRPPTLQISLLPRLAVVKPWMVGLYWMAVPFVVYSLLWTPHLQQNQVTFWRIHQQMLGYHQSVGSDAATHPYCSTWQTWPLMLRPVAYLYQTWQIGDGTPTWAEGLAMPNLAGRVAYDVHAMGNPVLWWLATFAIALLLVELLVRLLRVMGRWLMLLPDSSQAVGLLQEVGITSWTGTYLLLNYGANWLPWMIVSRCLFLYHYMAASIFAMLAISEWISRWLNCEQYWQRITALAVVLAMITAFLFWLPLYLGLPLPPEDLQRRWWLESWI
jgi:dolichyl-phosphate-mannose--protein O-mannosyl transferase